MRDFEGEIIMRPLDDSRQHAVVNYSKSWKHMEKAREINPYVVHKDLSIDYRFWNEFHSSFYATIILASKKTKIIKIQYIDWDEMRGKEEPKFDKVIKICDRFQLSDITGF